VLVLLLLLLLDPPRDPPLCVLCALCGLKKQPSPARQQRVSSRLRPFAASRDTNHPQLRFIRANPWRPGAARGCTSTVATYQSQPWSRATVWMLENVSLPLEKSANPCQ
jgi:hypothetical protein